MNMLVRRKLALLNLFSKKIFPRWSIENLRPEVSAATTSPSGALLPNGRTPRSDSDVLHATKSLLLEKHVYRRFGNCSSMRRMHAEPDQGKDQYQLPEVVSRFLPFVVYVHRHIGTTSKNGTWKPLPTRDDGSVLQTHPYGAASD
jgi:hypothetical protein